MLLGIQRVFSLPARAQTVAGRTQWLAIATASKNALHYRNQTACHPSRQGPLLVPAQATDRTSQPARTIAPDWGPRRSGAFSGGAMIVNRSRWPRHRVSVRHQPAPRCWPISKHCRQRKDQRPEPHRAASACNSLNGHTNTQDVFSVVFVCFQWRAATIR